MESAGENGQGRGSSGRSNVEIHTAWTKIELTEVLRYCPHCGSTQIAPSRRRGWFDWLFQLIGRTPFRCQMCSTRFFDAKETRDSAPKQDVSPPPPTGGAG